MLLILNTRELIMSKIVLDELCSAAQSQPVKSLTVRAIRSVNFFRSNEGEEPQISEEELSRREREGGRASLKDLLAALEKLA